MEPTTKPRHVVLFLCDQMQQQRLGTEDPRSQTPHLDELAREGVSFRRAYCSNAQCAPSRASLQTGLYPHESGVMVIYGFGGHTGHLDAEHITIARAFQAAGYQTALFGKSHFGYPIQELGYAAGVERGGGPSLAAVDRQITEDAIAFLDDHPRDVPLFLIVSWHQPHPPFEEVQPFHAGIDPASLELPASFADDLSGKPSFQLERRRKPDGGYQEATLRVELARYYSMISAVDAEVGRMVACLRSKDMWDDSVVAFTSDHGDLMGAHGLRLKGPLPYEELYRVPLIMKAPGILSHTTEALTVNVELPGTLLDLAGVARPAGWPELPHLAGLREEEQGPQHVFMEHYGAYWGWHPFRMVVTSMHKYVRYYGPDEDEEELYDLASDPGECHNIVRDPACQAIRTELRTKVDAWWAQTGGRDWDYYESDDFRLKGSSTLIPDNHLWAET